MDAPDRRNLTRTETKRLQREWRHRTERRIALLLDSVQTPPNVGSIFRTAAAFDVEHIYLAGSSASPRHPKSQKTSLRTEHLVSWSEHPAVEDAVRAARDADFAELIGIELASDAVPITDLAADLGVETAVCLIVGHEQNGLSKAALRLCDRTVFIPIAGRAGPLNVAASATVALYEVRRTEWAHPRA